MATIGALSNLNGSQRGVAVLAKILQVSPFLRFLDTTSGWEPKTTDFLYRVREGALALQRRNLNGGYTSTNLTPSPQQEGALRFVGFQVDIDQTHLADDRNGDIDLKNWLEGALAEEVDSFARAFEAEMFKGTGTNTGGGYQMHGLKTLLNGSSNIAGFSSTMTIDAADWGSGDSFDFSPSNDDAFMEGMQIVMAEVEDLKGIAVNPTMYARINSVARRKHLYSTTTDQFGKTITQYDGVDLVKTLDTTIGLDEPDNAGTPANNTTSLYLLSPGEGRVSLGSNSGLEFQDYKGLESKEAGRLKGEVRSEWVIQKKNVVRRVRNFKL